MKADPGLELAKLGDLPRAWVYIVGMDFTSMGRGPDGMRYGIEFQSEGPADAIMDFVVAWSVNNSQPSVLRRRRRFSIYVNIDDVWATLRVDAFKIRTHSEDITAFGSMARVFAYAGVFGQIEGIIDDLSYEDIAMLPMSSKPVAFYFRTGDE